MDSRHQGSSILFMECFRFHNYFHIKVLSQAPTVTTFAAWSRRVERMSEILFKGGGQPMKESLSITCTHCQQPFVIFCSLSLKQEVLSSTLRWRLCFLTVIWQLWTIRNNVIHESRQVHCDNIVRDVWHLCSEIILVRNGALRSEAIQIWLRTSVFSFLQDGPSRTMILSLKFCGTMVTSRRLKGLFWWCFFAESGLSASITGAVLTETSFACSSILPWSSSASDPFLGPFTKLQMIVWISNCNKNENYINFIHVKP